MAACAEIIARPLFIELERAGAIKSWSSSSSSPSLSLSLPSPMSSLESASVALQILRGGLGTEGRVGGGGRGVTSPSFLTSNDIQHIRTTTLRSLPSIEMIVNVMTAAYKASWVPEVSPTEQSRGGRGEAEISPSSSSLASSSSSHISNGRVAWAAAYPAQTGLSPQVRDGSASDDPHSYVRAAVDGLLLDAAEVRGYEASARTAIRNFAERELFEMKRLLSFSGEGDSIINKGRGEIQNVPLSLPALLEQFFSFNLDSDGNLLTDSSSPSSFVKMTGYIDRVDIAAIPAEHSARYHDGQDTMEVTIREFKSGQHWKYQRSAAFGVPFYGLKDKLKTLQPDIYGIAVSEMLKSNIVSRENKMIESMNRVDSSSPAGAATAGASTYISPTSIRVAIESIELGSSEGKLVNDRVTAAARSRIVDVAKKIKSASFEATPGEMACSYCGFNNVCEFAFKK